MNLGAAIEHDAVTLHRIETLSRAQDLEVLSAHLGELRQWVTSDLEDVETELSRLDRHETPMHGAGHHLVSLGGKRLRPLCVALASRVGNGFSLAARDLAVAAELVHSATLLHDDVVDLGERRRGAPTSRVLFGNIAAVYAGDWLLVEALGRIRRAGFDVLLDSALEVLREMLHAEALQLATRGTVPGVEHYFSVVEGKTASLFRWSLMAGAMAGGVPPAATAALARFGHLVGVAFQLIDDVLDVAGEAALTGKPLFADLREGKVTYPLLVAIERDPEFARWVSDVVSGEPREVDCKTASAVSSVLASTGAISATRALAIERIDEARQGLSSLPDGRARAALEGVASMIVARVK